MNEQHYAHVFDYYINRMWAAEKAIDGVFEQTPYELQWDYQACGSYPNTAWGE